jgi:excisionase family DNA binding protein
MDQAHTTAPGVESPLLEPVYTTGEIGKMLKVSQRTVQDWVKTGVLTAVQYGKHLRIRPSDLASFGKVRNPRPAPDQATDGGPSPAPADQAQE